MARIDTPLIKKPSTDSASLSSTLLPQQQEGRLEGRAPSDEILIRSFVIEKKEKSFVTLINRYTPKIRGLLHTLLNGSLEDMYDVEQEILLTLFRSLKNFSFRSQFSTYLYRVCTNTAINWLRTAHKNRTATEALTQAEYSKEYSTDTSEQVLDKMVTQERVRTLNVALSKLSIQDKTIIHMRIFEQLSTPECARVLEIAEGTVKSRLSRAQQRLAHYITALSTALSKENTQEKEKIIEK